MRWLIHTAALILSMGLAAHAQVNLIRNWSFEQIKPDINGDTNCYSCAGCVYMAQYWTSAHGSVDYFNSCSNEDWPLWGVPANYYGVQRPFDGLAYSALATYYDKDASGINFREHLMQELELPLTSGFEYKVTFWVSLCDSMEFATNGLAALFSADDPRYWPTADFVTVQPQVEYLGPPISDKIGWTKVEGTFIAQGDERFMSIGCFLADEDPDFEAIRIADTPNQPDSWDGAGYYLDAISLYEIGHVGLDNINTPDITVFPNPSDQEMRILHAGRQGQLTLREITGRTVSKSATSIESTVVGTSDLGEGMYILEFFSDTGTKWQFHVVVQHR